jgi:hypothetical protein
LALGADSTCAQLKSAIVECVGGNEYGQLGGGHLPEYESADGIPEVVLLADEPTAPTAVSLKVSALSATLRWSVPRSAGTAPLKAYVVAPDPSMRACVRSASIRSCSFKGLKGHTRYTFSVAAQNKTGSGPAAVSAQVYPDPPGPLRAFADPTTGYLGSRFAVVVLGARAGQSATITYLGHVHLCRLNAYSQCWVTLSPTSSGKNVAIVRLGVARRSVAFVSHT